MTNVTNGGIAAWRRQRPFVGGLLVVLAGVEMFFSTQLDIGQLHIQMGIEGFQATIIPIGLVLLGVLAVLMPQHRIFYGVIALALSIYSIIGVNLGGFIVGMLLSAVGGILVVSWLPKPARAGQPAETTETTATLASSEQEPERVLASVGDGKMHAEAVPFESLRPGWTAQLAREGQSGGEQSDGEQRSHGKQQTDGEHRSARKDGPAEPPPFPEAPAKRGTSRKPGAAAAALLLLAALTGLGAAKAPASEPAALCIPLLMSCSTTSPSPSPSPSGPLGGVLGGVLGGGVTKGTPGASSAAPLVIGPDNGAPIFTLPAGQLGGSSISISGIHQVGLVTVSRIDGSRFPVIKLVADDVVITGFLLDVRRATGPSLVSTADRMELKGHVQVYLDSLTGTTLGGLGLSLGTDATPPPGNELPPKLLRVNLGLVGTTADSITYANLHQELHE